MAGGNRPSLRKALDVFQNRDYRYLWASSVLAFIGMQIQQVARGVLAWELTESFGATGLMMFAFGLPLLLFSLFGGAIADRFNKRDLAILTQVGIVVVALITSTLIVTDRMTVELLFVLGLFQGTWFAIGMPARQPLMALVVGEKQLMSAMAMGNAAMNGTRLIGPALAGMLIVWNGVEAAYFTMAGFYFISLLGLFLVPRVHGRPIEDQRGDMLSEIRDGIHYVITDKTLRFLLLLSFITAIFAMPHIALLPGFVERDLGMDSSNVGVLMAVSGIGAVVGSLLIAMLTEYPRKPMLQFATGQCTALGLILLGILGAVYGFSGAIFAILFLGFALTAFQTVNMTMFMVSARPEYFGRIMSIMMLTFSTMPMMAAPLGVIADRTGASSLFIALGIAVAAMIAILSASNWRYVVSRVMPGAEGSSVEAVKEESS